MEFIQNEDMAPRNIRTSTSLSTFVCWHSNAFAYRLREMAAHNETVSLCAVSAVFRLMQKARASGHYRHRDPKQQNVH